MSGGLVMHSASQMRLPDSASASSSSYPQEGEGQRINSELWHACAGPLVSIPTIGSRVVYFPQGHSEQVAALTQKQVDAPIPNYPNLPAHLMCHLHHATLHADIETDEVYAQLTLQPISNQEKEPFLVSDLGTQSQQPANFFCKTLTPSDTSTHGGFSIPRRAADKVFPPLDYTQQPPAQELIAKDLHNNEWKFRHIYRGQPKRHLLTTGWSVFVSAKRLTAGDSVLFIRNEKGELLLGIRHANRVQNAMPSSVLSSDSMHIGILAAAAHAAATNSCFTVFYNPRASPSEFVISLCKYEKAIYHTRVSVGMRFRMLFETEESSVRRYMGTITGISDSDPVRWPSSHWRSMKVGWDESMAVERPKRVSLWEIEPITTFLYPPVSNWRLKYPWPQTLTSPITTGGVGINNSKGPLMWTRGQTMDGVFQGLTNPWAPSIQGMLNTGGPLIRPEFYNAMGMVAETRVNDPLRQLSPFQSPPQQMLPYATQVQSQSPVQYPHQAHMPHPSMYSNMQNETPQQVQQNSPISPPSVAPISSSPMPSHSQQTNIVAEPVCAMPTPGVHHPLQSILSGLVGEDRGSPSSMLPSTQILEQRHDSHAVSDSWFPPLNMITMQSNFSEVAWSSSFAPNDQTLLSTSSNPYSLRDYSQDQASLQTDVASHLLFQGHDSIGTTDLPLSSGMLMDDESLLQHAEALTQVQPPTRTFTKVYKVGSVGRSLDVTRFNNYSELRLELGRMFNLEGKLEEPQRSGWQLVFIDKENDALLLGDDPWEEFVSSVRCIRILSPPEVLQMTKEGIELLSSMPPPPINKFEDS